MIPASLKVKVMVSLWWTPPSHHVLVSVRQVHGGGRVLCVRQAVGDGVFLDAGVVHGPRALPRHQQAAQVVGHRLDVLRLRAAH